MRGMLGVNGNGIDFVQHSNESHIESLGTMGSNWQRLSERNLEEAWNLPFHGQDQVPPLVDLLGSDVWLELEQNDVVNRHDSSQGSYGWGSGGKGSVLADEMETQ